MKTASRIAPGARPLRGLFAALLAIALVPLILTVVSPAEAQTAKKPQTTKKGQKTATKAPEDLPNFHQVGPGIYRGAAPTVAGLDRLRAMGIRRIIDLRIAPRTVAKEKEEAKKRGMDWINLPMSGDPPTQKQINTLIAALREAPTTPVFVHCQHGCDRTGCMIGIWRVQEQSWPFAKAWTEMRQYGFDPQWKKLTESVRKRAK